MHQDIPTLLQRHRTTQGLRLADVSAMSGLGIPTIRLLERGSGNLSSLQTYLDALHLRLHWHGLVTADFGSSIAQRRKTLSISQRALAAKVGVSHRTIIALENEFRGRAATLSKVMGVLQLKLSIRGTDQKPRTDQLASDVDDALQSVLAVGRFDGPNQTLLRGDALEVLRQMPPAIVDCVMTSPPYWQQRTYEAGGIGEEQTVVGYLTGLRAVFKQVHRILKPHGSLWINIDDSYHQKSMQGIPWRLVLGLIEDSGWLVRNDVIWHKSGGALNRADNRMTHRHEHLFHLVKQDDYYFDADAIRHKPRTARVHSKEIATATGLTLAACHDRIRKASELSEAEQDAAVEAITNTFEEITAGKLHDFRLVLRGGRVTHSDRLQSSARAGRIDDQGFYILRYDPRGSLPGDVWDLAPDRSKGRDTHYAAYPIALCERPILATCPAEGLVLDPFVGTGTTLVAANQLGRRGIGIDLSAEYLGLAENRLKQVG